MTWPKKYNDKDSDNNNDNDKVIDNNKDKDKVKEQDKDICLENTLKVMNIWETN